MKTKIFDVKKITGHPSNNETDDNSNNNNNYNNNNNASYELSLTDFGCLTPAGRWR